MSRTLAFCFIGLIPDNTTAIFLWRHIMTWRRKSKQVRVGFSVCLFTMSSGCIPIYYVS